MPERIATYAEFWPCYLGEHRRPGTRALHLAGTGLGIPILAAGILLLEPRLIVTGIFVGYGLAWLGHACIERNRPATFRYPLWSLVSDLRMLGLFLSGRLGPELARHGLAENRRAE